MLVLIEWIILAIGIYLVAGSVFAVAFVLAGVGGVSPAARDSGWAFRVLIAPGSAVLWPWLAYLWYRPSLPPPPGVDEPIFDEPHIDPEAETKA